MVFGPVARQGGKNYLKKVILPMLPGKDEIDIYVEPFVGAGNIFYNTPEYKKKVINDIDKDMFIIHKALKNNSDYINNNIERNFTKSNFDKVKDKKDAISILQKCKMSFFGNCRNFNSGRTDTKIKTDFSKYGPLLKNTTILNRDFRSVIKKYDSPKTFFYLDPPYEKSEEQGVYQKIKEFIYNTSIQLHNSIKYSIQQLHLVLLFQIEASTSAGNDNKLQLEY
jgi:DNA adenine methylase